MLASKHKKDLIKLKQNYSFKFIPGVSERDALNKAGGDINSMHDYDVIFLANSLAKRHPDGNQIYFIKQKNNLLKKNLFKKQINFQFIYNNEELLEASESFYDFLFLASPKQKGNPDFYTKALNICPVCILDYADHLPKDLDQKIIEDIIARFPFLYSFINSKFTIPNKITKKFIQKKLYFCDAELLKDRLTHTDGALSIKQDLEVFMDNEVLRSLFGSYYDDGFDGQLIDTLGLDLNERNLELFNLDRETKIYYSAKFCSPDSFLNDLFSFSKEPWQGIDIRKIALSVEKYEELSDIIRESDRPMLVKHEMNVYLIMFILLGCYDDYFFDWYDYRSWKYWMFDNAFAGKKKLFTVPEKSKSYFESPKICQLFFSYPSLTRDFRKDFLNNVNLFLLASTKSFSDRPLRHIYQKQRRGFTRKINSILENSNASVTEIREYKKHLREFQSIFFCRRLYGKAKMPHCLSASDHSN